MQISTNTHKNYQDNRVNNLTIFHFFLQLLMYLIISVPF